MGKGMTFQVVPNGRFLQLVSLTPTVVQRNQLPLPNVAVHHDGFKVTLGRMAENELTLHLHRLMECYGEACVLEGFDATTLNQGGQFLMVRIWHVDSFYDVSLSVNEDAGGNAFIEGDG